MLTVKNKSILFVVSFLALNCMGQDGNALDGCCRGNVACRSQVNGQECSPPNPGPWDFHKVPNNCCIPLNLDQLAGDCFKYCGGLCNAPDGDGGQMNVCDVMAADAPDPQFVCGKQGCSTSAKQKKTTSSIVQKKKNNPEASKKKNSPTKQKEKKNSEKQKKE